MIGEFERRSKFTLMCPYCYNLTKVKETTKFKLDYDASNINIESIFWKAYNNNMKGYCKHCKHDTIFVILDRNIADIVSLFNLAGFETIASCEGHKEKHKATNYISPAYVSFSLNEYEKELLYRYFKDFASTVNNNPIHLDKDDDNRIIFFLRLPAPENKAVKKKYLSKLYEFAKYCNSKNQINYSKK